MFQGIQRVGTIALLFCLIAGSGCAQRDSEKVPAQVLSFEHFRKLERAFLVTEIGDCGTQECRNMRQEFRYLVYVGKQIYCYWDEKKQETGTDFDALARTLESGITDLTSPSAYLLTVRRWAAAFHDGHVNVLMKAVAPEIELYSAPVRFEVLAPATDHEKLIIARVDDPALPIKVGDEVVKFNGVSAAQALDQAELISSGSTPQLRRFSSAKRLSDSYGTREASRPLRLVLKRDGNELQVSVPRLVSLVETPPAGAEPAVGTGLPLIAARVLPSGAGATIGYLRIDGFSGSQDELLLAQAMRRLSITDGLLIDVRRNGGGDQSGNQIISRLITEPVIRYKVSTRVSDFTLSQRPELFFGAYDPALPFTPWENQMVQPVASERFSGPVVLLTSTNCFSACDTFSSALKVNGLATVVGESTGGGTGSPLVFDLPYSGHQFRYSVARGRTAHDEPIEGIGTEPHVRIEATQEERAAKQDRQLESAIAILESKMGLPPTQVPGNSDLRQAIQGLSPIWEQHPVLPPTLDEAATLRRLSLIDERS